MTTFEKIRKIIINLCEIDKKSITKKFHLINDLRIDNTDLSDIAFDVDGEFGIKIPLEQWKNKASQTAVDKFVLKNFCCEVDKLVAAKDVTEELVL